VDLMTWPNSGTGSVGIWTNQSGSFATASPVTIPGLTILNAVAADINGDGNMDIFGTNGTTGALSCAIGNGSGNAATGFTLGTTTTLFNNADAATADFNLDGMADALVTDGNVIAISTGSRGTSCFDPWVRLAAPPGRTCFKVLAVDLDLDGRPDIAASCGILYIWRNLGGGAFASPVAYANYLGNSFSPNLKAADLNLDGYPDLVVSSSGNGRGIVLGDFTGDGIPDLAWGNVAATMRPGDGTGRFPTSLVYSGHSTNSISAADFNNDGRLDIVMTLYDGYAGIHSDLGCSKY
jgi:hypothetical protein